MTLSFFEFRQMLASKGFWATALLALGMAALGPRRAGAQTLTLEEVETQAQRQRPELDERRASIERANAELAAAVAQGRPTLGARADASIAPGGQLVAIPSDGDTFFVQGSRAFGQGQALAPVPRFAAQLAGKWTLLDFGRTALGVRAAEAGILAERASLLQAKVELVRVARSAYLDWIEAHQTWQLAQRDAEVTAARTASVRQMIEEGARPATDATLSAYDEQLARLREARARRASLLAFESLSAAIQSELPTGAAPDLTVIEAAAPGPAARADTAPAQAHSAGLAQGLSVLDRQRDAALSAARAAERGRAPQLDLGAELGVQAVDSEVFPAYRATLSLTVPLFDGGALSAAADKYRAEAHGLAAHRQRLEQSLAAARRAAQSALRSAGEELAMSLELLATAEALLTQAEDHYRSGSDTLERVLSAQRSLVQARREVLTSKLENARARLELEPVQIRD